MKYIQKFNNETDYNSFVENVNSLILAGVMVNNVLQPRIYEPPVIPTIQSYTFQGVPSTCPIYVPSASVDAYKAKKYWKYRASYIQAIS